MWSGIKKAKAALNVEKRKREASTIAVIWDYCRPKSYYIHTVRKGVVGGRSDDIRIGYMPPAAN